jgi:hypothetical protein
MKHSTRLLSAAALCLLFTLPAFSDVRKDPKDVLIALDKSLSMVDKVDAVKEWVNTSIVDGDLNPGDYLVVVAFYGKADVIISQAIAADADKAAVKRQISSIVGNGHFTDIGNALDVLKEQEAKLDSDGRAKQLIVLTDGIQEAPPGSKYYSKDGSFNNELLKSMTVTQQKGWKIMVLGIGTGTMAKQLAGGLNGAYAEVSQNPTAASIAQATKGIFATITMADPVRVAPVRGGGASSVDLSLQMSSATSGDTSVVVSGITARVGTRDVPALTSAPVTLQLKKDATTKASIPVTFPSDLPAGTTAGTLTFSFSSAATFPATADVTITVNSALQNRLPVLGAGALGVLVLIALAVFLVLRLSRGGPLSFSLLIENEQVGDEVSRLSPGRQLFLNELSGAFSLVARRSARSLAMFAARKGALVMTVLKQDRFPKLKEPPADARGRSFVLKSENGRSLSMKVQSAERK